jgi:hypothetical protein
MIDIHTILEFSRQNCVAICAFLIPATLLTTISTLVLLFLQRPISQIRLSVSLAMLLALTISIHVGSWLAIAVVTPISFILLGLGTTCFTINLWAIKYPESLRQLLQLVRGTLAKQLVQRT